MKKVIFFSVVAIVAFCLGFADQAWHWHPHIELSHDEWKLIGIIAGGLFGWWLAKETLKKDAAPRPPKPPC